MLFHDEYPTVLGVIRSVIRRQQTESALGSDSIIYIDLTECKMPSACIDCFESLFVPMISEREMNDSFCEYRNIKV